jgi:hypothetical protein
MPEEDTVPADADFFKRLNASFYDGYNSDFFLDKAAQLCNILSDLKGTQERLNAGFKVGKIEIGKASYTQKSLREYAQRELTINSYHCIESFFRLLFAHLEEKDCPWVGVQQLQNFWQFKDRVLKILNREYFSIDHDEAIAMTLLGGRSAFKNLSDEKWEKAVRNTVNLVDRMASDILTNQDYNVYKHGGALFNTHFGFRIDDGSVLKAKRQPSFMYLSSSKKENAEKIIVDFQRTFKFIRWEERFVSTVMATHLIKNVLALSRMRLGVPPKKPNVIYSFSELDLHKVYKNCILPDSMSESLFTREFSKGDNTTSRKKS